jgi:cysteine synthase A
MRLSKYAAMAGIPDVLLGKCEMFNPTGSIKDRAAKSLIDDAENRGLLVPGSVIIEPTSGNTGIALAAIAASRGYRLILTMPDAMTAERRMLLKAYGAELVLTEGRLGMAGAIAEAVRLTRELPMAYMPGQFENPANPAAHFTSTGPEIWDDTGGGIDVFVAGIGTGGTISGAGKYLKSRRPSIRVVGVEPAASAAITRGESGAHAIQGIGAGFIPKAIDFSVIDEVMTVTDADAIAASRDLARGEGLLAGVSSGAALWAAGQISAAQGNEDKRIAVILPDAGSRYISTGMFD